MALPCIFKHAEKYFEHCLLFFNEFQYLYKFPNTDILVNNVLDNIDVQNTEVELEILKEDTVFQSGFFIKLKHLEGNFIDFEEVEDLEESLLIPHHDESTKVVPLGEKKKHEIIYLAKEIENLCKTREFKTVVDVGSGLGYLDQLLFERTNFNILGLECNRNYFEEAKKRQIKFHQSSTAKVKYKNYTVSANSHEDIKNCLSDTFADVTKFCIVGLHSCADLTITAMNIFLETPEAVAIALMPCCYHKMSEINGRFQNFPLSECLKKLFEKYQSYEHINVPFLRLATQPPCRDDECVDDLVFNLLARGVLQLYAKTRNCRLKRNKRKAVRMKNKEKNIDFYFSVACSTGFTLISNANGSVETFNLDEIKDFFHQNVSEITMKQAKAFIFLQNCLQPVFENFVLLDRLVYLQEKGVNNCEYKRIVNNKISPRCFALLANK